MRNKTLLGLKLERLSAEIKKIGYYVNRNERDLAYENIAQILEKIEDMQTLLNTEHQD